MDNDKLKQTARRTEEVRDIIDQMPHRTSFMVALFLLGFTIIAVILGFVIEYPETVSGPVTITARQAPVRLVSNVSGKLHLLKNNGDWLHENDIIGFMDNPARLQEVLDVEIFMNKNPLESLFPAMKNIIFPETTSLGELSSVYYSFRNAVEKWNQYKLIKPFETKKASLVSQLNSQMELCKYNLQQMHTKGKTLRIAHKNVHRDSLLYTSSAIAELELDRSAISYLSQLENTQSINKDDASYRQQISDTRHRLQLLSVEQQEAEQQLRMDLVTTYNELFNNIRLWKQRYLFVSPFSGTLESLNFWRENDFLQSGIEVFSVLPADNPLLGQVYLPSQGAGKVEIGQKVIIKLENYPYMEYGSVDGRVRSISMLTNQAEPITKQNNMHTYLVSVDLPRHLTTNYGTTLDFRYEIKGIADIVTKPRKLIERLFDNLKYIASKK